MLTQSTEPQGPLGLIFTTGPAREAHQSWLSTNPDPREPGHNETDRALRWAAEDEAKADGSYQWNRAMELTRWIEKAEATAAAYPNCQNTARSNAVCIPAWRREIAELRAEYAAITGRRAAA